MASRVTRKGLHKDKMDANKRVDAAIGEIEGEFCCS